jgi:DNA-binding transcriptional ArsR family regulator
LRYRHFSVTIQGMSAKALAQDPFNALGDPHRRAIVELLADRPRSVREIADAMPISRPAVSRHLRLLKEAGLVVDQPAGTRRLYRLHELGVEAVREYLEAVWGQAAPNTRAVSAREGS